MLLWGLVAVLALAVIGVVLYKTLPLLHPPIAERAPLDAGCDVRRSPCAVRFDSGGGVRLDIRPRGIPVVHPLQVEVVLDGLSPPRRVELDLVGVDMDMGYNRVALELSSVPTGEPGDEPTDARTLTYRGGAMLPICVRDRMTWEARVLLHQPRGILAAPFRFETVRVRQAP
ncbi:hypothetical protein F2Q65_09190 [Thiohalocapsa marina]|uniref:Uncharacterized protein n=2 Tax=Thiohalocapsa marina TaxID=424902 RepID=A0A5M8FQ84_9GAMM|nr:hypothetical protein F2Q65_09190 [Thiohalocapsa marina]